MRKTISKLMAVSCAVLSFAPAVKAELIDYRVNAQNPAYFAQFTGDTYEYRFDTLPMSGMLPYSKRPWSDDYWKNIEGGIAYRWQFKKKGEDVDSWDYWLASKREILLMSPGVRLSFLKTRSPAEKFDIARGRFDYPTVMAERRKTSDEDDAWEGICHGWTRASLLTSQPAAVMFTSVNPEIIIPFASSDVKALLSYYYSKDRRTKKQKKEVKKSRQIGRRNYRIKKGSFADKIRCDRNSTCRDTNAGTFHLAMANELGRLNQSFAVDVDPFQQVWNQPLAGYRTYVIGDEKVSRKHTDKGIWRRVKVKTDLYYVKEYDPTYHARSLRTASNVKKMPLYYILELNMNNEIVGGSWVGKSRYKHPDFAWKARKLPITGSFAILNDIYRPAH